MAQLTVSSVTKTGVAPTFTAASVGGDSFVNDGQTVIDCNNGSGGALTVTVVAVGKCNQGSLHSVVVSVPSMTHEVIGPFPVARFGRNVSVTYSGVTSLTVAAYDLAS
jgi:hypothetical protein